MTLTTFLAGSAWCLYDSYNRPNPLMDYVPQEEGIYDTSYKYLGEPACRSCHGASLGDRHHLTQKGQQGLCTDCHQIEPPPDYGVIVERDCVASGCHGGAQPYANGWHHMTDLANASACTSCHDPNLISEITPLVTLQMYPPTVVTPTPFSCENCHWEQSEAGDHPCRDPWTAPYPYQVVSNFESHHMGFEGFVVNRCYECHGDDPSWDPSNPLLIRYCERCHTSSSLHGIEAHVTKGGSWEAVGDSSGGQSAWEPTVYRTFTVNEKCLGCHGDDVPTYEDMLTLKPVIEGGLEGIQPKVGAPGAVVTIKGQYFGNKHTDGRDVELRLKGSTGPWTSVPILLWSDTMIEWTLPAWTFDPGNYKVRVRTEAGKSNRRGFTVRENPKLTSISPEKGAYGQWIDVEGGGGFGAQRECIRGDGYHGYQTIVAFTSLTGTWIATTYRGWNNAHFRVRFYKLYQDGNGNYVRDPDELITPSDQIPLEDYTLSVNTIYFGDHDGSGGLSAGDILFQVAVSNPITFTLTRDPIIYRLNPDECGPKQVIKIRGHNFGIAQDNSTVHIGGRTYSPGHRKIKLWSNTKIRIRIPGYPCKAFSTEDHIYRNVWVTIDGVDSNKEKIKVIKPLSCP